PAAGKLCAGKGSAYKGRKGRTDRVRSQMSSAPGKAERGCRKACRGEETKAVRRKSRTLRTGKRKERGEEEDNPQRAQKEGAAFLNFWGNSARIGISARKGRFTRL